MAITAEQVNLLRGKTAAGFMQCKKALEESGGDVDKAVDLLRKMGAAAAEKKVGRTAGEGLVYSYIHPGSRVGVLLEINCETDFVARNDDFKQLCHDIALHIAASVPIAVRREEVDSKLVDHERSIFLAQASESGKPEAVQHKMVEGRIEKFFGEFVLLEQPFIKDPDRKVQDLVTAAIAKLGENIVVRRFTRYQIGSYPEQ